MFESLQIYGLIKREGLRKSDSLRMMNNERTALQFLINDLYASGYRGARTRDSHFPLHPIYREEGPYQYLRFDRAVSMFSALPGRCYGKLPLESCQAIQENSDVLIIYNIPTIITQLKHPMQDLNAVLNVKNSSPIRAKALVLISDNEAGDLFIASDVEGEKIFHELGAYNKTASFCKRYDVDAEIVELDTVAYYLKDNALIRDDILLRSEEILRGVKDFKVHLHFDKEKYPTVNSVHLRLTSIHNQVWDYEIAIRNRYGIHRGVDIINLNIADLHESPIARALDIQVLP